VGDTSGPIALKRTVVTTLKDSGEIDEIEKTAELRSAVAGSATGKAEIELDRTNGVMQSQQSRQGHAAASSDARILADFTARVQEYDALRKDLAKKAPPLKKTDDPAEIMLAEKALAQQIKAARAGARQGDLFTPATQRTFRRLLNPTFKGDEGVENKIVMKEDTPSPARIPFAVNAEYPKDQPLSTVPPDLLKALPPLPDAVQYRFAGKHLMLYCTRGNLIVDYMLNAIP
jgi:hypothetical protein